MNSIDRMGDEVAFLRTYFPKVAVSLVMMSARTTVSDQNMVEEATEASLILIIRTLQRQQAVVEHKF